MIYRLSDNVISPLGETTEENYQALKAGRSALCRYTGRWGIPEPFTASLFTDEQTAALAVEGLTRFESLAFRSAEKAVKASGIDVSGNRTLFILSTTKANVELLSGDAEKDALYAPGAAAKRIATALGVTTEPMVVCNACISGVAAIVLALRLLNAGLYDDAVICGADVQSKFTVSGFQSLKAVSEESCRPFDIERLGLNLGEAAATLVVSGTCPKNHTVQEQQFWTIERGAVRNDAFHISSPSKNGEGARMALSAVLQGIGNADSLAFINAHGTATMFNDQMESVAIERAGLSTVPVNGLKGYFGHTLGAAGLLETIISMAAIDDHTLLATRGFEECGVSGKIRLSAEHRTTDKQHFIKMISGFGGCNGTLYAKKELPTAFTPQSQTVVPTTKTHTVRLTPTSLNIDGRDVSAQETGASLLTWLYKQHVNDYPKYYKMDGLSRLGLIATELLLKQEGHQRFEACEDRAVILFNNSSSVGADRKYLASIAETDYFPSPSVFVYTLPNIVTGEIAMRNLYHGETSFYITNRRDDQLAWDVVCASFADPATKSIIGGWIDYQDDSHFEANLYIVESASTGTK